MLKMHDQLISGAYDLQQFGRLLIDFYREHHKQLMIDEKTKLDQKKLIKDQQAYARSYQYYRTLPCK